MCPVASEEQYAFSRCDGAWTPPHMPGLYRPVAGSKTSGWCTGFPKEYGFLGLDSPFTEAVHRANPREENEEECSGYTGTWI